MSKLFKLIHGSTNTPKHNFITVRERISEAYSRFAAQNDHRNVFYVVINGIAAPISVAC